MNDKSLKDLWNTITDTLMSPFKKDEPQKKEIKKEEK